MHGPLPGFTRHDVQSGAVAMDRVCAGTGAGLGRLPSLQLVTLTATNMTAVCGRRDGECDIDDLLPWCVGCARQGCARARMCVCVCGGGGGFVCVAADGTHAASHAASLVLAP
jgi:hypothetical protein